MASDRILFLMGPTASGKTDLALRLCERHPFELISVDSMLVYRGMDIGTAKPDRATLARFPHHLIDIRDPSEPYSVADFLADVHPLIDSILARGRTPLLVGGTMLYFRKLLDGISDLPSADPSIRAVIEELARNAGWEAVHRQLAEVDPVSAERLKPGDSQRVQRALEVYRLTGRRLSELQARPRHQLRYDVCQIGLLPAERRLLHQRIESRFRRMLDDGWVEEVRRLHARADLHRQLPAMRATGYRQILAYLDGEFDYLKLIETGIMATRQLAKRQITWLRSWHGLQTLEADAAGLDSQCLKILRQGGIVRD